MGNDSLAGTAKRNGIFYNLVINAFKNKLLNKMYMYKTFYFFTVVDRCNILERQFDYF